MPPREAPNAKKKIKDLNPIRAHAPYGVYNRYDEFLNLLMNAVSIKPKGKSAAALSYVEETFAKRTLFEMGCVGYFKITKQFYFVYGMGLNEYGRPTEYNLVTANGKSIREKASYDENPDGAYCIDGLPIPNLSMGMIIKETTDFMTNCDVAMRQNLEACKTPYIVVCRDDNLRLSFDAALEKKQLGQAAIVVSEDLGEGLKAISVNTPYLVDKFAEIRNVERNTLLNKLGILTSNIEKKERVQSTEVNATLGQATDYIYLLIDTFNKQCETYALPFEMVFNGSMEELYENREKINTTPATENVDINEIERKENNA